MVSALTNLLDFPDNHLFWFGSVFRQFNVGMSNVSPEENYYDYLLVQPQGEDGHMLVVNVSVGNIKSGYILCYVQPASENANTATAHEIRRMLGSEQLFYLG